jgi:hypothetical protein
MKWLRCGTSSVFRREGVRRDPALIRHEFHRREDFDQGVEARFADLVYQRVKKQIEVAIHVVLHRAHHIQTRGEGLRYPLLLRGAGAFHDAGERIQWRDRVFGAHLPIQRADRTHDGLIFLILQLREIGCRHR